ncbi:MAG TPA: CsgG/HfaB family protein [Phycisphaerae bacterium]|nr:CsgG/HfaB family protein [Phycisphaerae bacterium]
MRKRTPLLAVATFARTLGKAVAGTCLAETLRSCFLVATLALVFACDGCIDAHFAPPNGFQPQEYVSTDFTIQITSVPEANIVALDVLPNADVRKGQVIARTPFRTRGTRVDKTYDTNELLRDGFGNKLWCRYNEVAWNIEGDAQLLLTGTAAVTNRHDVICFCLEAGEDYYPAYCVVPLINALNAIEAIFGNKRVKSEADSGVIAKHFVLPMKEDAFQRKLKALVIEGKYQSAEEMRLRRIEELEVALGKRSPRMQRTGIPDGWKFTTTGGADTTKELVIAYNGLRSGWSFDPIHLGLMQSELERLPSMKIDRITGGQIGSNDSSVRCDVRLVAVSDGSIVAQASGTSSQGRIGLLAESLANTLRKSGVGEGKSVAVLTMRNRGGTQDGAVACEEISDRLTNALVDLHWYRVRERVNVKAILDEKDFQTSQMDSTQILQNPRIRESITGVDYVILGGVSISSSSIAND